MYRFLSSQPKHVEEIEAALKKVLLQPVKINLAELGGQKVTANAARLKASPGAKPSQAEINAAKSDPQVKQVQQILGGRVRRIDRIEE